MKYIDNIFSPEKIDELLLQGKGGFDIPSIRDKVMEVLIYQKQEQEFKNNEKINNKNHEIVELKELINNFFYGSITINDDGFFLNTEKTIVDTKTINEVYEVMSNHLEDPETNLKAVTFTQELDQETKKKFVKFGLELENKYYVHEIKNENGGKHIFVYPLLSIRDFDVLGKKLGKIQGLGQETKAISDIIIGGATKQLEYIIKNNDQKTHGNIFDFMYGFQKINKELERLRVWDFSINQKMKNYIIAHEQGFLEEYLSFRDLGFYGDLQQKTVSREKEDTVPSFIDEIIDLYYDGDEEIEAGIQKYNKIIKNACKLLYETKKYPLLFKNILNELKSGLSRLMNEFYDIENAKDISILDDKFDPIIEFFDTYQIQIEDIENISE